MSNVSTEGRIHSRSDIQTNRFRSMSKETEKVNCRIRNTWLLNECVKGMNDKGNLTGETLAEFFCLMTEVIDDIGIEFVDVKLVNVDWKLIAALYEEA